MKDVFKHIKVGEKEYPLVFNINVIQAIQQKYGKKKGLSIWGEAVQPTDGSDPDLDAIIFFCKEAINEGIDMENDQEDPHYKKRDVPRPFINEKQAARIVSATENFGEVTMATIAESNDTGKEKNLMTEQIQNPMTE